MEVECRGVKSSFDTKKRAGNRPRQVHPFVPLSLLHTRRKMDRL